MIDLTHFKVGDYLVIQRHVTEEDKALNYGSGSLEKLFATPSLVKLAIEASAKLLDEKLPEGYITVGKVIHIDHVAPTVLGETVTLRSEISEIEGNRVALYITAFDEIGEIGRGYHHRFVVNKGLLLNKANERDSKVNKDEF